MDWSECLLCKHKALSSNPRPTTKTKNKTKKTNYVHIVYTVRYYT
jgi:hypothetical protein